MENSYDCIYAYPDLDCVGCSHPDKTTTSICECNPNCNLGRIPRFKTFYLFEDKDEPQKWIDRVIDIIKETSIDLKTTYTYINPYQVKTPYFKVVINGTQRAMSLGTIMYDGEKLLNEIRKICKELGIMKEE